MVGSSSAPQPTDCTPARRGFRSPAGGFFAANPGQNACKAQLLEYGTLPVMITRREFLAGSGSAAIALLNGCGASPPLSGAGSRDFGGPGHVAFGQCFRAGGRIAGRFRRLFQSRSSGGGGGRCSCGHGRRAGRFPHTRPTVALPGRSGPEKGGQGIADRSLRQPQSQEPSGGAGERAAGRRADGAGNAAASCAVQLPRLVAEKLIVGSGLQLSRAPFCY